MREAFFVAVLVVGLAGVPFSGAADTVGGSGKLAGLRQVESTSDGLSRALRNTKLRALVAYKPGAGGTRCLTQYLLADKKFEDDVVFP